MMMSIWAFRGSDALLRIRRRTWSELIAELGRRGQGWRESGAFLMGHRGGDGRTVTRVVYLDDLDPNCLQGHIRFDGRAYSKLWNLCDAEHQVVLGDVHTHGGSGVGQSPIDAANPMIATDGHVALVVPHLAERVIEAKEVGVHLYRGSAGWESWYGPDASSRLFVRRWV